MDVSLIYKWTGTIAFVTQCIFVQDAFAGPLASNSDNAFLTTNQVLQTTGTNGPVWALFLGIFTITVLRSSKVDLLPSWGVIAGYGAAILVMTNGLGSAFGLIPDAANLIILIFVNSMVMRNKSISYKKFIQLPVLFIRNGYTCNHKNNI